MVGLHIGSNTPVASFLTILVLPVPESPTRMIRALGSSRLEERSRLRPVPHRRGLQGEGDPQSDMLQRAPWIRNNSNVKIIYHIT